MKKEELFDLLEETDDKYIEEALWDMSGEFDSLRPVVVRAGKTRFTPIKIIAPIAACLAVAIGAGFVISNKDKLAITPADSVVTASGSTQNTSELTPVDEEFVKKCQEIVSGESKLITQNETAWQTRKLDVDFDGEDEYLIYPQINTMSVSGIGVRVFKKSTDGIQDLGAFDMEGYNASLDGIFYKYPKDGVEAYYFYSEYFDYSTPDGRYIKGTRQLYFNSRENKVETYPDMLYITEFGPTDCVVSEKYYIGDNEVTETKFYTCWFDYPNMPAAFGDFDFEDVQKCKQIMLGKYSDLITEKCVIRTITIDGTPVLLIASENNDLPGIFVFKKTDDGVEELGTINGLNDIGDIKYYDVYNAYSEIYWYYVTHSEPLYCVESGKSSRQTDVIKIEIKDDKLSQQTLYSLYEEHDSNDARNNCYKINDNYVSQEAYINKLSKYSDIKIMGVVNVADLEYPPLDMSTVPALSTSRPRAEDTLARAVLASKKYGEYDISLLGNDLYTYTDSSANGQLWSLDPVLLLSVDGKKIYFEHTQTYKAQFEDGISKLDPNELDKIINIIELENGTVIALKFDGGDTRFFKLMADSFEPVIPTSSNDNQVFLSDDYRVEGDIIIDNENGNEYPFQF